MTESRDKTTAICGYDADRIRIRGRDLSGELMGRVSFTELFLWQALGSRPTPLQVTIVDAVMVTIMEHGLVPSAIVARLTKYGAPESFQGAIAAGLLGVGDRYAGTAALCGEMIERLLAVAAGARREAAVGEIRTCRRERRPVPGFGHPVHQQADPRVERLIAVAREAGVSGERIAVIDLIAECLEQELGRRLPMNISAAIAAVLGEAGVPSGLMRGIVLTARCAGLAGHVYEEMQNPVADAIWKAAEGAVPYRDPGED
jgi:citrate synthase